MKDVRQLLFSTHDPYKDFELDAFPYDLQGWGGHRDFFERVIERAQPKLIVEVGSWKGKSAISMAHILDDLATEAGASGVEDDWSYETQVLCIDTWLGATEFIDKPNDDPKRGLKRLFGYPEIYYTFLTNVCEEEVAHRIVPFPQTSTNAARFLKKNEVVADLVYIDGSHEYEDVLADLKNFSSLLRSGAILCGDDYCEYWRGVKDAIDEFRRWNVGQDLVLETKRYDNPEGEAPSDYWVLSHRGGILA